MSAGDSRAVPDTEAEALAWFRDNPGEVERLEESSRTAASHLWAIVRAALARDVPAGGPPEPKVMCLHCRDEFGPDDMADGDITEVVCSMCAKAGWTAAGSPTTDETGSDHG